MNKLNALSTVLDKNREVSIQAAIIRLLSLPMKNFSVKVKYLSSVHLNFRVCFFKGNIKCLDADEPIFHSNPHEYYENRPKHSNEKM